jgi:hypothetical protein
VMMWQFKKEYSGVRGTFVKLAQDPSRVPVCSGISVVEVKPYRSEKLPSVSTCGNLTTVAPLRFVR